MFKGCVYDVQKASCWYFSFFTFSVTFMYESSGYSTVHRIHPSGVHFIQSSVHLSVHWVQSSVHSSAIVYIKCILCTVQCTSMYIVYSPMFIPVYDIHPSVHHVQSSVQCIAQVHIWNKSRHIWNTFEIHLEPI